MVIASVDMTNFNRGLTGLINQVGLNNRVVIKKETGELIKTLVRITPKAKPEKIRSDISGKFNMVGNQQNSQFSGTGPSGINWYSVDEHFLRGIAPEADKTNASVSELKKLLYTITKKGKVRLPFKHLHLRQEVILYQTITTKAATVNKLIAAKIKNRGRLAAAWLVAVFKGNITLTGAHQPPAYIMKHATAEARGYFIDGTHSKTSPSFMIANYAAGIGNRDLNGLVNTALKIRAKAMAANTLFFMKGKKNLADYAK